MFVKACIAGAMALALNPVQQASTTTTFVTNAYIEKISCLAFTEDGIIGVSGTGFKLDDGKWVSVNHVTENLMCQIDGRPIRVTYADPIGDFSIFDVPGDTRRGGLHADCSGYHDRQWYHAQGHARGWPVITSVPILFSQLVTDAAQDEHGWAVLVYNRVIPGQSGGPILNDRGEAVGTVNALGIYIEISYSKPLQDTPICAE